MTWAVGGSHLLCCRCISDVQVTLNYSNGKVVYHNAVTKTHLIGPKMLIAFAGSIKLAFSIVDKLKTEFYPRVDKRLFNQPIIVAKKAEKFIRHCYQQLSKTSQESLEILLLIAPSRQLGGCVTIKLTSPNFDSNLISAPQLAQIGSGAMFSEFSEVVKKHSVWGLEQPAPDGGEKPILIIPVGKVAMKWIAATAADFQVIGVSQSLHISMLTYNTSSINEFPSHPRASFPKTANTWEELVKILGSKGEKIAECLAFA